MKEFLDLLTADAAVEQVKSCFAASNRQTVVYGAAGSQKAAMLAAAYSDAPRFTVIITSTPETAYQLQNDLRLFLPDTDILELPAMDVSSIMAAARGVELAAKRMDVLGHIIRGENTIVVACAESAVQKGLSRQEFERASISIQLGMQLEREAFLAQLVQLGYSHSDQVENIGQFSCRGGIVDVYPINVQSPVRVEFFDDEIDSLRLFDIASQRSIGNISSVDILPLLPQQEVSGKASMFLSYLPDTAMVVFDEPARIREQLRTIVRENPDVKKKLFTWPDMVHTAVRYNVMYFSLLLQKTPSAEPTELISITTKAMVPFHKQMDIMADEIKNWQTHQYQIFVFMTTKQKAESLKTVLDEHGVSARLGQPENKPERGVVCILTGTLLNGFEFPNARLAAISEREVLGRQKKKALPRAQKAEKISYFRDINIGDYVVHVNHGIGKYVGVETLEVGGVHRDYLHIKYGGDDKLFVPTDQVHLLQKYIGSEGEVPRLHKMGGTEWAKAKARVKASVADIAQELIRIYAARQMAEGFAFAEDTTWQREFEDAFPYEETPDQLSAIEEIKRDMESTKPMDRLLCGDVGFGKTEVAIRAAFKAVMGGKQVAVLVPTTVLAQQHYQTFKQRFDGFGPQVDVVCRFRTPKEQRETFAKVESGQIDVLIGTHGILNENNVRFKDLGLLIVDEEQRFGVTQKEKIKKFSHNIDVLTLSATPIPRTLHMSLVGARDMSIIETPPEERFPVQTYVVENNDAVIRDAIRRELKRGGQVYFVYNRVETIDKISTHLAEMMPDAKIQTAHGQMSEELLEQVMLDFYEGRDDILVATSIIENGLDVSNANTIIVYDADKFGLSQLYQMRGRVGRSTHMAFAYFVYQADKVLTEVAEKRLQALKEFTELGSGFKIAMRDLEIRGAGNLLGAQQHGHIASVGFEMYCNLLEEAVQKLKNGSNQTAEKEAEPVLELEIEAYLPGDYINDAMHKIEVYQRIAAVRNEKQLSELTDELIDRFGQPPQEVVNLLHVARIKNKVRLLGIQSVIQRPACLELVFGPKPNLELAQLMRLRNRFGGLVKIAPDKLTLKLLPQHRKKVAELLEKALSILLENEKISPNGSE